MDDVFAHKNLVRDPFDHEAAIGAENNNVVDVGTLGNKDVVFVFFQTKANKTLSVIDKQLGVVGYYFGCLDVFEGSDFGAAFAAFAVFFQKTFIMGNRKVGDVFQIVAHLLHFLFQGNNMLIRFEGIVFGYPFDADFGQLADVVFRDVAHQAQALVVWTWVIGWRYHVFAQFAVDGCQDFLPTLTFFNLVVNPVFDEDFFQTGHVPFFQQLAQFDFQLRLQQIAGAERIVLQNFLHGHKPRPIFMDHAGVGRKGDFTIGKSIEGINGYIGRSTGDQFDLHFYISTRQIDHLFDLDFPFIVGLDDAFDQGFGGYAVG